MKKLLLAMLFAAPFVVNAQFNENFDAGTTAPAGWSVINGGDTNTFIFGPGAPGSALSQPNAAQINYSTAAHDDYLITKAITVTAGVNDRLYYFVKNQDPLYVESYDVKLSTTVATAAAFTTTLTASALAPSIWTQFSLDLTSYVGQTVYIGFHSTSTDQFRLLFDDVVSGTMPTVAPGCAALLTPADGATKVEYASVTFTWTPSAGAEYYEIYADTNPNPTTKLGIAVNPTFTAADLPAGSTVYWKVVAKNGAGEATGCSIFSFETTANPYAPYCGPVDYASGVEPITSVNFGGMTNTSDAATGGTNSHELFLDKIANVSQGATLPIVLQGNTDGPYIDRFIVFIDWNQNGNFADAGETYFDTTALTIDSSTGVDAISANGSIAVPANATLGNTRMRVKKTYSDNAYPDPCAAGGFDYGQSEDYTVFVSALAVSDTSKNQMSVYPNPVKDVLNITKADSKITETSVYSMDGKLVKSVAGDQTSIRMSDLAPGAYLVKVKTSTVEKSFKIIKK